MKSIVDHRFDLLINSKYFLKIPTTISKLIKLYFFIYFWRFLNYKYCDLYVPTDDSVVEVETKNIFALHDEGFC